EVGAGEFVTLVGPNGAGKTTLLKAISGTVAASEGRVAYQGRDVARLRASERAALGIAHVPEGRRVFPTLTVRENLELGSYRRARRLTVLRVEQRVVEALELCDRGYVLETGRVVLAGDRDALLADPRVQRAYLGG